MQHEQAVSSVSFIVQKCFDVTIHLQVHKCFSFAFSSVLYEHSTFTFFLAYLKIIKFLRSLQSCMNMSVSHSFQCSVKVLVLCF